MQYLFVFQILLGSIKRGFRPPNFRNTILRQQQAPKIKIVNYVSNSDSKVTNRQIMVSRVHMKNCSRNGQKRMSIYGHKPLIWPITWSNFNIFERKQADAIGSIKLNAIYSSVSLKMQILWPKNFINAQNWPNTVRDVVPACNTIFYFLHFAMFFHEIFKISAKQNFNILLQSGF